MNGRPIPGFYWDPEKKKYFRVQANHVAPAGSQYSREAVKRRKLDNEQRQRKIAIDRRVRRERVRRSRCIDYTFTRLGHEIGMISIPGFARKSQQGRVYVSHLHRQTLCSLGYSKVFDFVRHGPSGALVAANCMPDSTQMTLLPPASNSKSADVWNYDKQRDAAATVMHYELSSLSICDSGYLLATYFNGISGDSIAHLGSIPNLDSHHRRNTIAWGDPLRSLEITFWCSEARPNSSSDPIFAVGTSAGLQTIHADTNFRSRPKNVLQRPKDVLAVEWLSHTVIASGFRDSLMFLSDLRSNDSVHRIKHPGMIGQIKKIDDHQLVVAGIHSLRTYDLRFAKREEKTDPKQRRRGGSISSTRPYLVFENYNRENHHSMDINRELGLLATTTEDRQNIRFYSLADGSIVPSPTALFDAYNDRTLISKIRFEEYQYPMYHRQAPRLLYAEGPDIVELAW